MQAFIVPIAITFFLLLMFLSMFNWVYGKEVRKVGRHLGVTLPLSIEKFIRFNLVFSIVGTFFMGLLIGFLLFFR